MRGFRSEEESATSMSRDAAQAPTADATIAPEEREPQKDTDLSIGRRSPATGGRVPELDGLRGLAISLVIVCHYVGGAVHAPLGFWMHHLLSVLAVGWSGVDLFFVLSGFLIGGILLDERKSPRYFSTFYARRVYRIFPIYYLWLGIFALLAAGALWLAPGRYAVETKDLTQLPYYLLYLQNMRYALTPFQWIWLSVMWSLAVEEQFYLVAPPLIRFFSERKVLVILLGTMLVVPVLRLIALRFLPDGTFVAVLATPCRADALAAGVLLAIVWRKQWFRDFLASRPGFLKRSLLILALGFAALLWWLAHPINVVTVTIGYTWLAIFYSCLLLTAISQPQGRLASIMRVKWLRRLGMISYCVYLVHATINQFAHRLILHDAPEVYNLAGVGVTLLALAMSLAVASMSWKFFEKPLLMRGHRYQY